MKEITNKSRILSSIPKGSVAERRDLLQNMYVFTVQIEFLQQQQEQTTQRFSTKLYNR